MILALFAVPSLAGPIQADLAEEAQLHFTLGLQAYKARQFPTALAHLLQSNRLAPNSNTSFNVALCYDRLAQPAQAWRFYAASLQHDGSDLDAEKAMKRLAPLIGRLSIDSDPPGARVYVERRDLGERGTTPLELAMKPGTYSILVERDGYVSVTFERKLSPGDVDSVAVPLTAEEVPTPLGWATSIVRYDGEVVLEAAKTGCSWLPGRGGLGLRMTADRDRPMPSPYEAPGSWLGASQPMKFALDVTVTDGDSQRTTRHPLAMGRPGLYVADARTLRQWALDACPPMGEGVDRASVATTLQTLPKALRRATVAVLGELNGSTGDAANACVKGDCGTFAKAL